MKPEDVDMALLHPNIMLASDGLMDNGQGHPRAAGLPFPVLCAITSEADVSVWTRQCTK